MEDSDTKVSCGRKLYYVSSLVVEASPVTPYVKNTHTTEVLTADG